MNLPPEITTLLQDEAYATLCHESLTEALARISREKEEILSTRPPFGMLASSQTRQVFQTSLRAALDNEAGLTTRLDQINQIDLWLKSAIEKALSSYLPTVSVEYRTCNDAALVVTRWEHTIEALHEISLALARDAHAVGAALNPIAVANTALPTPTLIEQARIRALSNLRATVMALQSGIADVMEVRGQFAELCDTQADGLQLPMPPEFRNLAWVDRLASLSEGQTCAEVLRCETEARAFCAEGIKALLRQGLEVREACFDAAKALLAKYWRELRAYAQANFVQERDVDEVIAELSQHRLAAEASRRQSSFESANVSSLR
jgi:hypothetical protein